MDETTKSRRRLQAAIRGRRAADREYWSAIVHAREAGGLTFEELASELDVESRQRAQQLYKQALAES